MDAETTGNETFEDLLRQFDDAVTSLESDELSLDGALSRYEFAVELAERCSRMLQDAELRIRKIDKTLESMDSASEE